MTGTPLNREEIAALLERAPPLMANITDLEQQLQPNGFDLTVRAIAQFDSPGQLGRDASGPQLPETTITAFGENGWVWLQQGSFLVTFNETVSMPPDLIALARPRSSLLRCGGALHAGVWDAGYQGRSQALLSVQNQAGLHLQQGARIAQMVFFRMSAPPAQGYRGRYQGEGIGG